MSPLLKSIFISSLCFSSSFGSEQNFVLLGTCENGIKLSVNDISVQLDASKLPTLECLADVTDTFHGIGLRAGTTVAYNKTFSKYATNKSLDDIGKYVIDKLALGDDAKKIIKRDWSQIKIGAMKQAQNGMLNMENLKSFTLLKTRVAPELFATLFINALASEIASILRVNGYSEYTAAYVELAVKQARVAFMAARGGLPRAVLEETIIATEQIYNMGLSLYDVAKSTNALVDSTYYSISIQQMEALRPLYKKAQTDDEKKTIMEKIVAAAKRGGWTENDIIRYTKHLLFVDEVKYVTLFNLLLKNNYSSSKIQIFLTNNFNDNQIAEIRASYDNGELSAMLAGYAEAPDYDKENEPEQPPVGSSALFDENGDLTQSKAYIEMSSSTTTYPSYSEQTKKFTAKAGDRFLMTFRNFPECTEPFATKASGVKVQLNYTSDIGVVGTLSADKKELTLTIPNDGSFSISNFGYFDSTRNNRFTTCGTVDKFLDLSSSATNSSPNTGDTTASLPVLHTGQTVSYTNFDDAYYHAGKARSYTRDDTFEIVTDNVTKLMWQDDISVVSVQKPWIVKENYDAEKYSDTSGDTATTYCENLTSHIYSDWRLPNLKELLSIESNGIFKNFTAERYWSSTTLSSFVNFAWYSYAGNGYIGQDNKKSYYNVRCVRDIK